MEGFGVHQGRSAGYDSPMTKHIKPIAIAAVFLVGCAVGGASSHFVVPLASAQQQVTMTRWEYLCVSTSAEDGEEGAQAKANAAGREGWELASVASMHRGYQMVWCFKRPL